jgi:tetratricopeptide (TPR) repeat protein
MTDMPKLYVVCFLLLVHIALADHAEKIDLGKSLLGSEKNDEGIRILKEEIASVEKDLQKAEKDDLWYELGRCHFYLEEDAKAIAAYEKAIKLSPANSQYHFMMGVVLKFTGKSEEALKHLLEAEKLDAKDARCSAELAEVYYGLGKIPETFRWGKKAEELGHKSSRLFFILGNCLAEEKKFEDAAMMFTKSVELDSAFPNAQINAGQTFQKLGNHKESLKYYLVATKLVPFDWKVRCKLVQLYEALNMTTERDQIRDELYKLHASKNAGDFAKEKFFCRDQFKVGEIEVMVFEYFVLEGEKAVRYSFNILKKDGGVDYRISLGSYDSTTNYSREAGKIGPNDRLFHLDGYYPDRSHSTFGFFDNEPTYAEVKADVVKVLKGEKQPVSRFVPNKQP